MNILSISADRRLADPTSPAALRQQAYRDALGGLTILILGVDRNILRRATVMHRDRLFDAVTSQDAFRTGLIAWRISRRLRIPWVAQVHTDVAAPAFRRQSVRTFAHWLCARFLLPRAARIRTVSERAARGIRPWLRDPSRLVVLPLAWRPDIPAAEPREPFVLMASRLTGEKRIPDALRAFAQIRNNIPGITLRIAGDGPQRGRLETLSRELGLSDAVRFIGWREDVPSLMRKASAFILCSSFEGYGTVAAEALSAGCPVIMTDVGCAGELVIDRRTGRVVPVGNIPALAGALTEVLLHPERAGAYAGAGLAAVGALPDVHEYVARYAAMFRRLEHRARILFVTQAMDAQDSVLGFVQQWVTALNRESPGVTVIALRVHGHQPDGIAVHALRRKGDSRARVAVRYVLLLWKLRHSYDSVFVHMNQIYVLLGAPLLKLLGKRIVLWRNHPKGTLATRIAVALSNRVLCTSTNSFTARFSKTRIMPVGIDTDLFAPGPLQREAQRIAMVGRVMPSKRVDVLIEAVRLLGERGIVVSVDIVGDTPRECMNYRAGLEKSTRGQSAIAWHPGVTHTKLPNIYRRASVMVNLAPPGHFDKVILEALACGTPVITANTDLRGHVDPRCLVDPADAESVAARLEGFLELPLVERAAIGAAGREYVVREHGLDALMQGIVRECRSA